MIVISIITPFALAFIFGTIWYWGNVLKEVYFGAEMLPVYSFGEPLYKIALVWFCVVFMALITVPLSVHIVVPLGFFQVWLRPLILGEKKSWNHSSQSPR